MSDNAVKGGGESEMDEDDFFYPSPEQEVAWFRAWLDASPLDWGGLMIRAGDLVYPASAAGINRAPNRSGIYALCDVTGALLYIGKANNLHRRLTHHRTAMTYRGGMRFAKFCIKRVPRYALRDVEVAHIYALEPELNKLYEPASWRGHKAMVEAIQSVWETEE